VRGGSVCLFLEDLMYSKVANRYYKSANPHYSFHREIAFVSPFFEVQSVTFLQSLSHTLATNSARVFFAREKKF
jgi:hypothetical protein